MWSNVEGIMKTVSKIVVAFLITLFFSNTSIAQEKSEGNILIINAVINKENKAKIPEYLGKMNEVFKDFQGNPVGKYKRVQRISGEGIPEMVAIIRFPNQETITNMIESKSYEDLSALRKAVFTELKLAIYAEKH